MGEIHDKCCHKTHIKGSFLHRFFSKGYPSRRVTTPFLLLWKGNTTGVFTLLWQKNFSFGDLGGLKTSNGEERGAQAY